MAQLEELEAKIEQGRKEAQDLRAVLNNNCIMRGTRARDTGRVARARINADDNVNDLCPLTRISQKLIAAVALLRAMTEPAPPKLRNLRLEAETLVEQVALQQAESSASHLRQMSSTRDESVRDGSPSLHTPQRSGGARAPCTGEQRQADR